MNDKSLLSFNSSYPLPLGSNWRKSNVIQKCSIAPGPQHESMEKALSVLIAEVEEEIDSYNKQLSEVNMKTPQKSNRSPDCWFIN